MNEEKLYVITESHLKRMMEELKGLPYEQVHIPMFILENLKVLEIQEPDTSDDEEKDPELIEG